ncbi:MAG TPA: HlyD family efflux transporter periplasmic adaptor subunit, partial [Planctomycetaceae bacterium]|nr:HlyD family efflux transporter periplasmic adaptor subunit [Planctomycetaceae bacterium]
MRGWRPSGGMLGDNSLVPVYNERSRLRPAISWGEGHRCRRIQATSRYNLMEATSMDRHTANRLRKRRGVALRGILITGGLLVTLPLIGWLILPRLSLSSEESGPMLATVTRGPFVHDITERGELESASNVDITCQVKSRSGGVAIIDVVPEGTMIDPEHCVPENAIIPLEAILQVEQWREENGFRIVGLPTPSGLPPAESIDTDGSRTTLTLAASEASGPSGGTSAAEATGSQSPGPAGSDGRASGGQSAGGGKVADSNGEGQRDTGPSAPSVKGPPVLTFEDIKDKMILVKLNSKELEDQLIQQKIVCENSKAAVEQAKSTYDTALIAMKEYLEGKYQEEWQDLQRQLVEAQESHSRAKEYLSYSQILYSKGFISDNELAANRFDVTKTQLAVEMINTRIKVLEQYTKEKILGQLRADIATAKAKLAAVEQSYELDLKQLRDIEEQIVNCTIFARRPGQVVYANLRGRYGREEIVIEPGTTIRERQAILRLPDPRRMQVNAKINEAKVALIEPGMRASIRLEASPDELLYGEVIDVGDYPAPT